MDEQSGEMSTDPIRKIFPSDMYDSVKSTFETCRDQTSGTLFN